MQQPPQHKPSGPEPQDAPVTGPTLPSAPGGRASTVIPAAEQELSKATQVLVESSNRALRQSSEKLSLLEAELSELRTCLESVSANLTAEREQRIVAEAQLAAHLASARDRDPAELLREAGERQLDLVERMEMVLKAGLSSTQQQSLAPSSIQDTASTPDTGRHALSIFLPALSGAALGGGVALLGLQVWWPSRQVSPPAPPAAAQLSALKGGDAATQPAPAAQNDTLHLRCAQPCWLDVREVRSNRILISRNLKGSLSVPIGKGLDVFTARGDLLKIRINDGPETRFSSRVVGKRQFLPPRS